MKVKALIDTILGGTTGHVIPMARGEERDVPEDIGRAALLAGVCLDVDDDSTGTEASGAATDGGTGDDVDVQTPPPDDAGETVAQRLLRVMQSLFEAGDPDPSKLRANGSPKFSTLRDAGADFPFTEADFDAAWEIHSDVNG